MKHILPHEQLDVYRRALAFAEMTVDLIDSWPAWVAVRGQMDRAMESVITNLVQGARYQSTDQGIYLLECSLGSVLECSACLDVALLRRLIDSAQIVAGKRILQEVARMEVGLRASWSESIRIREDGECYSAETQRFFAHESLSVYQRSLELHDSLWPVLEKNQGHQHRQIRRMDELSTSLTLNIAEGNGRFSKRDHGKSVSISEDAGCKLAAYMDLVAAARRLDMNSSKSLLREIMMMLAGLRNSLDSQTRT